MFFIGCKGGILPQIERIFKGVSKKHKMFNVGISMGIALTENFNGDFDELFKRADAAMYTVKREAKNSYRFYDDSMKDLLKEDLN